jgi:Skp family chaperone for outer membrane proteins
MRQSVIPALVLGVATAALAQEAAPKAEAKADAKLPKIAVIDMARVSSESLLGKGYQAQLEGLKNEIDAEGTKKQNELAKMDAQIKAVQDELEKQANVLSPDGAEKKRQEIVRKQRERAAFLEDGNADLERMREKARAQAQAFNNDFQQKIRPHIEAVAKEKGIDILVDNQVVLTMNKAFDISQEVIVKADDAERLKSKVGTKPLAEKPVAKPAASPSPSPNP